MISCQGASGILPQEEDYSLRSKQVLVRDDRGTFHIAEFDYDDMIWWSPQERVELRVVEWEPLPE